MSRTPLQEYDSARIRSSNAPVDEKASFVLYWMTANRRLAWNTALDRAVAWCRALKKPLLVVETLSATGQWASTRHHAFVLQGMADNASVCHRRDVAYYPFIESTSGDVPKLLAALAAEACVVITDDHPIRDLVREHHIVARGMRVRLEQVDANGLLPLRASDREFSTAYAFRRFLQRALPDYLLDMPKRNSLSSARPPFLGGIPTKAKRRWPPVNKEALKDPKTFLGSVRRITRVAQADVVGGAKAATRELRRFLSTKMPRYVVDRNHPDANATSGLSPYLHFGHLSVFEAFHAVAKAEEWSPGRLAEKATGAREGWWGMSPSAEAFLDQLITWRELGFNCCARSDRYDQYESLPTWARETLAEHANDRREHLYSQAEFEAAVTHDTLWNAAQRQLVREGRIHNYLRMLWGKKILEWTHDPREALQIMVDLNNKYALDGQDPNSYSGIFWILGRYDRPWGPERPIFGKVRYMSSENTLRKLRLRKYLLLYRSEQEE